MATFEIPEADESPDLAERDKSDESASLDNKPVGPGTRWPASLSSNDDLLAWAAMTATFIALASFTWGHWGDFQIDCGREFYVPIEILKGRLLYRDFWYSYGPLTPYLQALLVWCFGVHLNTFFVFGLVLTIAITSLMYVLARRVIPPAAAVVVATVCLNQAFRPFIFNYVFPYSYAAVIGLTFSLFSVFFLFRFVDDRRYRDLVFAGLAAGLALLSKQEFGVASFLTIAFVILWDLVEKRSLVVLRHQGLAVLPGLLLAGAVYGWFFWKLTPDFILRENFSLSPNAPFMKTLGSRWIASNGFRFVPSELMATFASAAAAIGTWFLIARFLGYAVHAQWAPSLFAIVVIALFVATTLGFPNALVPLVILNIAAFPAGMFWLAPPLLLAATAGLLPATDRATCCIVALLSVFAMLLGARVMVELAGGSYAIYYGPPLFLIYMIVVTRVFQYGARSVAAPTAYRLLTAVLAVDAIRLLLNPFPNPNYQPIPLDTSIGTFFTRSGEAGQVPRLVSFINRESLAGKRTMILPELPMLYVLTGTESPSRWYEMVPGMLDDKDEKRLIAEAESQQVEYIVVTNRNTAEYGMPYFGLDYCRKIYGWINSNFELAGEFGKFTRTRGAEFSAQLFKRLHKQSATPTPATSKFPK